MLDERVTVRRLRSAGVSGGTYAGVADLPWPWLGCTTTMVDVARALLCSVAAAAAGSSNGSTPTDNMVTDDEKRAAGGPACGRARAPTGARRDQLMEGGGAAHQLVEEGGGGAHQQQRGSGRGGAAAARCWCGWWAAAGSGRCRSSRWGRRALCPLDAAARSSIDFGRIALFCIEVINVHTRPSRNARCGPWGVLGGLAFIIG
eukprot:gene8829-biopygen8447